MVEQALDLGAVCGGAFWVGAGARVHQKRHRALQLGIALAALLVRHPRPRLVDLPRVRLQQEIHNDHYL